MSIDLNAIQKRADAATEGPWEVDRNYPFTSDLVGIWAPDSKQYIVQVENQDDVDDPTTREDANFIAAARMDVPALLAYARDLEARNQSARALHKPTCEINGDHGCMSGSECSVLMCGPCGESWPCPTVAALTATEARA